MNALIVFAAALACASASPQLLAGYPYGHYGYSAVGAYPYGYSSLGYAGLGAVGPVAAPLAYTAAVPAFSKTQYHAQDEFGQSSHGYAYPGQAAAETRDAAGTVRGSYSYVDPNGKTNIVNYQADAVNGFRVESNNLPVGPAAGPAHVVAALPVGPAPVQETPEVAQARAEHALAHAEVTARNAVLLRKRRGVAYTSVAAHPLAYNTLGYSSLGYNTLGYNSLGYNTLGYNGYYGAPLATAYNTPLAYNAVAAHPLAYHAGVVSPVLREATLTKVVNNPGHAVSYRVD